MTTKNAIFRTMVGRVFATLSAAAAVAFGGQNVVQSFTIPRNVHAPVRTVLHASADASDANSEGIPKRVAIVGGGPAGLLLANLILDKQKDAHVTLWESRPDPRTVDSSSSDARAYALGLGRRGRTAIRAVDEALWQAVAARGYRSSRFQLHAGPFVIPLRDEKDGKENGKENEPSLLLFQTDLCAALADELEARHVKSGRADIRFDSPVKECNLDDKKIVSEKNGAESFDLIVGCDGVNSIVRQSIDFAFPDFEATVNNLPGIFKVVKLDSVPGEKIDPTAVSLILPKSGATTAFFEPTGDDGSCCVLFAGREGVEENKIGANVLLENTSNITAVEEALEAAFSHKFSDKSVTKTIAEQLVAQKRPGRASSVQCNTYHFGNLAVLVGDAAHATGGVSGQGVNSALVDAMVLAEELTRNDGATLNERLLRYSYRQVPEGKALYELSFGPKPEGVPKKLKTAFINARDAVFRGRFGIGQPPLQTQLTTSLQPFADIRRERDRLYEEPFPSLDSFKTDLNALDERATLVVMSKKEGKTTASSQ